MLKTGLNVPAVTIVDDAGRVIEAEQRRVFRHLAQEGSGADVIFAVGTTGEWNRLANPERIRVFEIAVDELKKVNSGLQTEPVEVWLGVNGKTRAEILTNLDCAIRLGADAAVIAPLAIEDLAEDEIVRFFQRDLTALQEAAPQAIPVYLYDNADIAAPGRAPHIRTRIVKHLSRLPWVRGIKVSASRRVLGNYTRAALHYKLPGEFGIYIGNAMLIFDIYRPSHGLIGRFREGWRDFLLNDTAPIGVVSGPGNVMPREWQKAWRVCWAGDDELTDIYYELCENFERICGFEESGRSVNKTIACLKYALELDGVIDSSLVCDGTKALTAGQRDAFRNDYEALKSVIERLTDPKWKTINNSS
ncbi:MAG: dihydrodipicolinate synthase family protein [Acidobacteriota bacterium]|nr:MAG: dihydrodipicolinate synthase family protein [Acidobacteriota bacterium]